MEGRAMTDAPKEIAPAPRDVWLCPCGYESWRNAWVEDRPNTPNSKGEVQYTRTDIHKTELSALRDAVLEEAAQVAEARQNSADALEAECNDPYQALCFAVDGHGIAAAIRAMKGQNNV